MKAIQWGQSQSQLELFLTANITDIRAYKNASWQTNKNGKTSQQLRPLFTIKCNKTLKCYVDFSGKYSIYGHSGVVGYIINHKLPLWCGIKQNNNSHAPFFTV